ncbi:MAG: DUF87 domain-containing protein [bacterium]|nr:DUF87 domain-containing protein [bacterium]
MKYLEVVFSGGEIQEQTLRGLLRRLKEARVSPDLRFMLMGNKLRFFIALPENKRILSLQGQETQGFQIIELEEEIPQLPAYFSKIWPLMGKKNLLEIVEKKLGRENKLFLSGRLTRRFGIYSLTLWFQDQNTKRVERVFKLSFFFPFSFLSLKFLSGSPYKLSDKKEELSIPEEAFQFTGQYRLATLSSRTVFPTAVGLHLENFDFWRHTALVGQTGSGKSKFIELLLSQLANSSLGDEYSVILIDPHDSLAAELEGKTKFQKIDFQTSKIGLFLSRGDPTLSSELSLLLFESLMGDRWNDKLKRLLRYTLFVLFSQQNLDFNFLRKFLTDLAARKEVLNAFDGPHHVKDFFDTEFIEFQTQHYDSTFVPIINLIEELSFLPAISSPDLQSQSLLDLTKSEKLIIFSLNRMKLGNLATKMIAGLIIQQTFMLAQSQSVDKKLILAIDEVSAIENKALPQLLSEARKFNLGILLSFQYINQLPEELKESLFTNTYNWFAFKASSDDAKLLSGNIEIPLNPNFQKEAKGLGFSVGDIKEKILTSLNQRECIARVYKQNKFIPAFKVKVEQF